MDIVLVGNSSSVLDKKRGKEIDNHQFVVRFNNFSLTPEFSEYVGEKISYIMNRCTDDVKLRDPNTFDKIFFLVPRCRYTQAMLPLARNYKAYYGSKCEIINVDKCQETANVLDETDHMNEWPSIGILSVMYWLNYFPRISLVGFTGDNTHYFKRQPKDSKFHNWEKEQQYLKQLEKEGKVKFL